MDRGRLPVMYRPEWLGALMFIVACLFLLYGLYGCYRLYHKPDDRRFRNVLLVLWTIGPPLYFLFSYHVLFRYFGADEHHYWNSQGLYTKLWAGIGALLGLVLAGKIEKESNPE